MAHGNGDLDVNLGKVIVSARSTTKNVILIAYIPHPWLTNIIQRIIKQSGSAGEADHAYIPGLDWYLNVKVLVQVIRGNP